jgi:hypothetical protein
MSWTFQSFDDDSLSKMIDAAQKRLQSLATEDGDGAMILYYPQPATTEG